LQLAIVIQTNVHVGVLNRLRDHCIDNASEDVVAWVLVPVVLISVRIGHRSQKSTKYRASIHSAPVVLVLVLVLLVSVWTAKDVPEVETKLTLGESQAAAGKESQTPHL
jgi:hypothetical protein